MFSNRWIFSKYFHDLANLNVGNDFETNGENVRTVCGTIKNDIKTGRNDGRNEGVFIGGHLQGNAFRLKQKNIASVF